MRRSRHGGKVSRPNAGFGNCRQPLHILRPRRSREPEQCTFNFHYDRPTLRHFRLMSMSDTLKHILTCDSSAPSSSWVPSREHTTKLLIMDRCARGECVYKRLSPLCQLIVPYEVDDTTVEMHHPTCECMSSNPIRPQCLALPVSSSPMLYVTLCLSRIRRACKRNQ